MAKSNPPTTKTDASLPQELRLDLPKYQGPLDLLLELIRKHEVDIFDIPIALITHEYLAYLDTLSALNLEVGGEWLELAATLVHIKSKMLLPPDPNDDEEQEGPDPRDELVQRLIDYQMYKMVAEKLQERPRLAYDVFVPGSRVSEFRDGCGPPQLREANVSDLVEALQRVIANGADNPAWVYEVTREKLSMRSLILEISARLQAHPRLEFEALFDNVTLSRHRVVTTFLALLEMTRLKMIKLLQCRLTDDTLYIERAMADILEVSQSLDLPPNEFS